ncbi:MAG: hypothetical protein HUK15_05725, partial [Bacteroidales bacterium]|nr:hypothetical protein [Bacteroidales bacterium]
MKKLVFIFLGILVSVSTISQVSQDSALTIIKKNIPYYEDYDIYVANSLVNTTDTIQLLGIKIIIPPQDSCWMFFIDQMPLANWAHPCKYVFINICSGKCNVIDSNLPPINKNINLAKATSRLDYPNQDVFNNYNHRALNTLKHNYAVIISGGGSCHYNYERYWYNCAALYTILVNKFGYDKDKVYVIMSDGTSPGNDRHLIANPTRMQEIYDSSPLDLDGDGIDDIQYAATKTSISNVFDTLSSIISAEDDVFIFTTDHGDTINNQYVLNLWNNETLTSLEFASEVNKINKAKAINILLEQCFSGGFLPILCGDNRVVMSACSNYEVSYPMQNYLYDEFCYHWFSAMNGETPSGTLVDADINNDGYVSFKEAFDYAVAEDTKPEHPLYCSNDCQQQGDYFSLGGIIPFHISSNTQWNTSLDLYNDLIIDEFVTLTITSRIRFAPSARIIIQPGGKLIIDGGTLTN